MRPNGSVSNGSEGYQADCPQQVESGPLLSSHGHCGAEELPSSSASGIREVSGQVIVSGWALEE
jgi:hypothetical protein